MHGRPGYAYSIKKSLRRFGARVRAGAAGGLRVPAYDSLTSPAMDPRGDRPIE